MQRIGFPSRKYKKERKRASKTTAFIVIAIIVLLIALLLQFPLTLKAAYENGKMDFRVTYMFIKIFPFKVKEKKRKRGKSGQSQNAENTDNPEAPEKEASSSIFSLLPETAASTFTGGTKTKKSIAEIIEIAKSVKEKLSIIYGSSSKGLRRIMRRIIVDNVYVDITVRGKDAAKTAVNYGVLSGAVYGIIAVLSSLTTVYIEDCDVACDFDGTESEIKCGLKVKIKLSVLIGSGLMIGTGLLRSRKELFGKRETQEDNAA
jgi:hypothetical protein